MAKQELRNRAIELRKSGASYTQIKAAFGISKSTLSNWLQDYPLSPERLKELKTSRERQIERTRLTKTRKKKERIDTVYAAASQKIGNLSEREFFLAGLLLYWAEGTKASSSLVCMTNTDPSMLMFFLRWLETQGMKKTQLHVKLHLYADMDIQKETMYWSNLLGISTTSFYKPYIKKTFYDKRKNYKGRFEHGTCNLVLHNRDMYEFIMMSIRYLGLQYMPRWISSDEKGIVSPRL